MSTKPTGESWRQVLMAALLLAAGISPLVSGQAQPNGTTPLPLTADDRAEIRQLVASYAHALGTCAADDYAALFTPDGRFSTTEFRVPKHRELYGASATLQGHAQLRELVQTEEHCMKDASPANRSPRSLPDLEIKPSPEGATGKAHFAKDGWYEDVYVRTAEGWRFKSRMVFMPPRAGAEE